MKLSSIHAIVTWPWRVLAGSVTGKLMVVVIGALVLVIGMYSHLVMKMREEWAREQLRSSQALLRRSVVDAFRETSETHQHRPVQRYLEGLKERAPLFQVRVLDEESRVRFASNSAEEGRLLGDFVVSGTMERTMSPVPRQLECQGCHEAGVPALGMVVIDYPQEVLQATLDQDRSHLMRYALAMILLVGGLMLLAIWVVVHNPLSLLALSVTKVREGDLQTRLEIAGQDEFHELGEGFNSMVEAIEMHEAELEGMHARQMAQADRLASVGKLASGLAHEIKNPLHGIGGALTVVARKVNDPALSDVIGEIQGQVERVTRLLEDMLAFARPSRPSFQEEQVEEAIDKALMLLHAQLVEQEIEIICEIESDLPSIVADGGKLQQVLLNLLLNGIQATPRGGTIHVRLRRRADGHMVLEIEDSGAGIAPELAEHLFEPFYTTKPKGNGLGLAIVQTMVSQHGGEIQVIKGTGNGACFEVILPVSGPPVDREKAG